MSNQNLSVGKDYWNEHGEVNSEKITSGIHKLSIQNSLLKTKHQGKVVYYKILFSE